MNKKQLVVVAPAVVVIVVVEKKILFYLTVSGVILRQNSELADGIASFLGGAFLKFNLADCSR